MIDHKLSLTQKAAKDRKLDIVCCDNPTATKFTTHILAVVAEREAISARAKAALVAATGNGKKLATIGASPKPSSAPPHACGSWSWLPRR